MQTGGTTYYYVTNLQGDVVPCWMPVAIPWPVMPMIPTGRYSPPKAPWRRRILSATVGTTMTPRVGCIICRADTMIPTTCRFINADNAAVIAVSPEKGQLG